MLGITSDENVKKRLADGYPLLWSIPVEGTGYDGTTAFIFKTTKKLETCKKIMDLLGGQEFSDLMAAIGYVTPRPAPNALYGSTLPKICQAGPGQGGRRKRKEQRHLETEAEDRF